MDCLTLRRPLQKMSVLHQLMSIFQFLMLVSQVLMMVGQNLKKKYLTCQIPIKMLKKEATQTQVYIT